MPLCQQGGADRFCVSEPEAGQSCKTMDMGPVCHMVCLFTPQLMPIPIILLGDRGTYCVWMTCSRSHSTVQRLGLNPRSPIRKSNVITTTPTSHTQLADQRIKIKRQLCRLTIFGILSMSTTLFHRCLSITCCRPPSDSTAFHRLARSVSNPLTYTRRYDYQ